MQHSLSADSGAGTKARVTLESYSENCGWPCAQLTSIEFIPVRYWFKVIIAVDDAVVDTVS